MYGALKWEKLLSTQRMEKPGEATTTPTAFESGERNTFEADYDRVVFSEPFRRLAKKPRFTPSLPTITSITV